MQLHAHTRTHARARAHTHTHTQVRAGGSFGELGLFPELFGPCRLDSAVAETDVVIMVRTDSALKASNNAARSISDIVYCLNDIFECIKVFSRLTVF